MGSNTLVIAPFDKINSSQDSQSDSTYLDGYSKITFAKLGSATQISIFGYKSISDHAKKNIVINYTPAYGGSKQGIRFGGCAAAGDNYVVTGYGYEPFPKTLYGQQIYDQRKCGALTKEHNGIYKIYDANISYIKPTEIHLNLQ